MTPEQIDFDRKLSNDLQHGKVESRQGVQERFVVHIRGDLELTVNHDDGPLRVDSLREVVEDILAKINRWISHGLGDPIHSGGERQGPLGSEPTSQLREDRQVRVEPNPAQSSDAEREE